MLTIFADGEHEAGPASEKREVSETTTAVLYPHLTSRQLVHLGLGEENASMSPGNAKQGQYMCYVRVFHISAGSSADKTAFIISMSPLDPRGICPGSYLQLSLFDPASFHDSQRPLVDLALL